MPDRDALDREVADIKHQIDLASAETAILVRSKIEVLFGNCLVMVSEDDRAVVEGARILCYLYLHELENRKASSASFRIASNSLDQIPRLVTRASRTP